MLRGAELDARVRRIAEAARILPALTPDNAATERARLVLAVERGERPVPVWRLRPRRVPTELFASVARARVLAASSPAPELYLARLDELELELELIDALGDPRRVRPLSLRRYGGGTAGVPIDEGGQVPLSQVAASILASVADSPEPRELPAESLAAIMRRAAGDAGLTVTVRVEPRLAAGAAAGDRVVLVADRRFGGREALRLTVHEVHGHLVAAANGRAQPIGLLEVGTAGSFTDQEGLAIWLEEQAGVLDGRRLRILAARVRVVEQMHGGATFADTVRELVREHGFSAEDAVILGERAYRGGGVARDGCYLRGWLRVRRALSTGTAGLDELRAGRVGLDDLPVLRRLAGIGLVRTAAYRPSLWRSLEATAGGTRASMSPPSEATSFTRFDAT